MPLAAPSPPSEAGQPTTHTGKTDYVRKGAGTPKDPGRVNHTGEVRVVRVRVCGVVAAVSGYRLL